MITFSVGNLICVAFTFFFRTVTSADVVGGPEKGRFRSSEWPWKVAGVKPSTPLRPLQVMGLPLPFLSPIVIKGCREWQVGLATFQWPSAHFLSIADLLSSASKEGRHRIKDKWLGLPACVTTRPWTSTSWRVHLSLRITCHDSATAAQKNKKPSNWWSQVKRCTIQPASRCSHSPCHWRWSWFLRQTMAELFNSMPVGPAFWTFRQHSIIFCSLLKVATDVISRNSQDRLYFMALYSGFHRCRDIWLKVVGDGILMSFYRYYFWRIRKIWYDYRKCGSRCWLVWNLAVLDQTTGLALLSSIQLHAICSQIYLA